jgi:hypothetical protein
MGMVMDTDMDIQKTPKMKCGGKESLRGSNVKLFNSQHDVTR